jgi:hypothetical protein
MQNGIRLVVKDEEDKKRFIRGLVQVEPYFIDPL